MLDYRLKTFLLLSKTLNYTKTAQQLHMSQPAVSQHIQLPGANLQHQAFRILQSAAAADGNGAAALFSRF